MLRAIAVRPPSKGSLDAKGSLDVKAASHGTAVLQHDERHLRRKAIKLTDGSKVLADFPEPVVLIAGDELLLDNGAVVTIVAADEPLYQIEARSDAHLTQLAWHIGNRHLPAAIEANRILILRDHVIKAMLTGLGATVHEIMAPFNPIRGAYAGHEPGHQHSHQHSHQSGHGHGHAHGHGHSHHHHHD